MICIGSKSNLSEVINPSTKSSGYSELSRDLEGSKSSSYRHRAKFSCKHLLDSHPCRGVRGQGDWQHPNQLHQHPKIRTFDRQYVFQSHAELRSDQILHMRQYLKSYCKMPWARSKLKSTLNIVVEGKVFRFVFAKEFESIMISEIFKLNKAIFSVFLCNCMHEFFN